LFFAERKFPQICGPCFSGILTNFRQTKFGVFLRNNVIISFWRR
jgi:hypothetical protein